MENQGAAPVKNTDPSIGGPCRGDFTSVLGGSKKKKKVKKEKNNNQNRSHNNVKIKRVV